MVVRTVTQGILFSKVNWGWCGVDGKDRTDLGLLKGQVLDSVMWNLKAEDVRKRFILESQSWFQILVFFLIVFVAPGKLLNPTES